MRETFIDRSFRDSSIQIIDQANEIIAEYRSKGFTLTLRQLYYQFVARDLLPNQQKKYKQLGSIINDARLAGLIDWDAIEDRLRNLETHAVWDEPASVMAAVANQYKEDLWRNQEAYVEVWIEKDALIGVIEGICTDWRVPYFACRGNVSQSESYIAGKRMALAARRGKRPIVFHLGDHDPSGLDMTRDNRDRLSMFARTRVQVTRLALNMDQIQQYDPPPNPAKDTDSRYDGYVAETGTDDSWELDALDPQVIADLIDNAIREVVDEAVWATDLEEEQQNRRALEIIESNWDDVAAYARDNYGDE